MAPLEPAAVAGPAAPALAIGASEACTVDPEHAGSAGPAADPAAAKQARERLGVKQFFADRWAMEETFGLKEELELYPVTGAMPSFLNEPNPAAMQALLGLCRRVKGAIKRSGPRLLLDLWVAEIAAALRQEASPAELEVLEAFLEEAEAVKRCFPGHFNTSTILLLAHPDDLPIAHTDDLRWWRVLFHLLALAVDPANPADTGLNGFLDDNGGHGGVPAGAVSMPLRDSIDGVPAIGIAGTRKALSGQTYLHKKGIADLGAAPIKHQLRSNVFIFTLLLDFKPYVSEAAAARGAGHAANSRTCWSKKDKAE